MMTHDEMIAVIQAHKEGKQIECTFKDVPSENWGYAGEQPSWAFNTYKYRVKPEPLVLYLNVHDNDSMSWHSSMAAALSATCRGDKRTAVKMVEADE